MMRLDSDSKGKSVSSKHSRHKMGEENMMNSNSGKSKTIRSGSKHVEKTNGNCDGEGSDSSEELQYGPGIVNRLKTKYLSMTVREYQNRGARPPLSNMRRANSLENLLAAEKTETTNKGFIMSCAKKFETATETVTKSKRLSRGAKPVISRESMKRAHSVESLLRTFKDIVIEENNNSSGTPETYKVSPVKCSGVTELPPPDVVKETLKIFEKSPIAKCKNVTIKPATSTKPSILTEKPKLSCSNAKPMVSPKPIIITQNFKTSNDKNFKHNNIVKNNISSLPPVTPAPRNSKHLSFTPNPPHDKDVQTKALEYKPAKSQEDLKPVNNVYKAVESKPVHIPQETKSSTSVANQEQFKDLSNVTNNKTLESNKYVNNNMNKVLESKPLNSVNKSQECTSIIKNQNSTESHIKAEPKTEQPDVIKIESPKLEFVKSNEIVENNENKNITNLIQKNETNNSVSSKSVSNVALNNIRKSGTSVEFKFPSPKSNSHLPQDRNQVRQVGIIKPIQQPAPPVQVIPPIVDQKNKIETNVITKNQVNQVVLSIKTENVNLWDSKPWHHRQNTMIFNFCNRKDVPDYIENDGLCLHNRNDARVSFLCHLT